LHPFWHRVESSTKSLVTGILLTKRRSKDGVSFHVVRGDGMSMIPIREEKKISFSSSKSTVIITPSNHRCLYPFKIPAIANGMQSKGHQRQLWPVAATEPRKVSHPVEAKHMECKSPSATRWFNCAERSFRGPMVLQRPWQGTLTHLN
jgi:hypothetical protein